MKAKAMAAAVYLCRTDVTAPSCPPPHCLSQYQTIFVSDAAALLGVAQADSGPSFG